ncbi:DoxX family protein [Zavarzinia compransoris]|uniref:LysR family transcriptional regulator n=1 Tax=Zavarzinia compransoris TaxID=1264899 RepID=A0A317EAF6_9PROT|nr:DoxX family protein [Zavarzinia compransoris]PWR23542.1 LysR family transcriptional regulator [Zavarzinia compransoris]TDP47752.1 putative oxidoreductase [Zavarzinia compransoris]
MNTEPRYLPLIGRILLAAIFLLSGVSKLGAAGGTIGYIAAAGLPLPELAYVGAVALEIGGGILLIAGFKTRAVAAVLAVFSVVTAVVFHNAAGDQNQSIHLLKNLAIAGGLLQVAAFGAGRLSLDALRRSRGERSLAGSAANA